MKVTMAELGLSLYTTQMVLFYFAYLTVYHEQMQ